MANNTARTNKMQSINQNVTRVLNCGMADVAAPYAIISTPVNSTILRDTVVIPAWAPEDVRGIAADNVRNGFNIAVLAWDNQNGQTLWVYTTATEKHQLVRYGDKVWRPVKNVPAQEPTQESIADLVYEDAVV